MTIFEKGRDYHWPGDVQCPECKGWFKPAGDGSVPNHVDGWARRTTEYQLCAGRGSMPVINVVERL